MSYERRIVGVMTCCVPMGCGNAENGRSTEPGDAGSGRTATPGTCEGTAVPCDVPEATPLVPGEERLCTPVAREAGTVLWQDDLGKLDCGTSTCALFVTNLVSGADGSLWVFANVSPQGTPFGLLGQFLPEVGQAIFRYDASGGRRLIKSADFRTRVAGSAPATQGAWVNDRGHLLWIAPMSAEPGVELREYDQSGTLVARTPLVHGVTSAFGVIDGSESLYLGYEYDPALHGLPEAGTVADDWIEQRLDVARFENGEMRWNLTATKAFGLTRYDGLSAAPSNDGLFLFASVQPRGAPARQLLAAVGRDGNVRWARDGGEEQIFQGATRPGGLALIERAGSFVALDENGNSSWQLNTGDLLAGAGFVQSSGSLRWIDGSGRVWGALLTLTPLAATEAQVYAFSADASACATWPLDVPLCEYLGSESYCTSLSLTPAGGGSVFFGVGSRVGLAEFGGLP